MKRLLWLLFCLMCSGGVLARGGVDAVRKQVEASMLVTGSIVVAQDGSVSSYTLDQQDKLPPIVLKVIGESLPHWKFDIDISDFQEYMRISQAGLLKTRMNLRLVAIPVDDKNLSVSITEASFGKSASGQTASADTMSEKDVVKPRYPPRSLQDGVTGTVYVEARIGRDGKVVDLIARQVNLRVLANENDMAIFRNDLAKAALEAVKQWTFNVPTSGSEAAQPYLYAIIPINFCQRDCDVLELNGKWTGYVPGPSMPIPWHDGDKATSGSSDAIPSGVVFQSDHRLKLLTPPSSG